MKRSIPFVVIMLALSACAVLQPKPWLDRTPANPIQASMSNPASIYCAQQGYKHEIHSAADGSQSGVCVFPDHSTCEEWAYFRGECGFKPQASLAPARTVWPTQKASVEATDEKASGGDLLPGIAEKISNWWGVIKRTQPGAQFDDCFERQDLGQSILFGIDAIDPAVSSQIKALGNSGRVVHLYGTLLSNVPDCNGSQIQVNRIEVE